MLVYFISNLTEKLIPNAKPKNGYFRDIVSRTSRPMEALPTAPIGSDKFARPTTATISLGHASGDPGNPAGRARSPSGHGGNPTARKIEGELSKGDHHALAVSYAMELPSGGKRLPKGVGTALAKEFKTSKNIPGEFWKRTKEQLAEVHTLDLTTDKIREADADNRTLTVR